MSNLFKSKFFLGVMIVAAMFAVSGVVKTSTAAASTCSITSTLKLGSKGTQVVCLQTALGGLTADGSFGPKTKAAVVAWQAKEGLVADGIFGAKSRAQWEENAGNSANFPAGCTSTTGFSLTTGQSCATTVGAFPAGCTSALGFSPTTGASCATTVTLVPGCNSYVGFSPTTGASCATGVPASSTNPNAAGNISSDGILGGFANTVVGVGDQNHQVAGFQLTGAGGGSNLNLTSLTVQLLETGNGSSRIGDYFSAVSIYQNGVVVGSVPASAFSSNTISGINNYVYSANIPLTNAKVLAGQQNNFYVAITANSSMDSANYGAAWAVLVNNIRFTDGTGTTLVYNPTSFPPYLSGGTTAATFTFNNAVSANNVILNVQRGSADMNAHTVTVNATGSSTQKVPLLAIDLSTQGGQTVSVNKIPVTFTPSAGQSVFKLTSEVYLMSGTTVLDSEAVNNVASSTLIDGNINTACGVTGAACTIIFKINPSSPLLVSSKQTVTVAADINSVQGGNYTAGSSLTVSTPGAINSPSANANSSLFDLSLGTPNGSELVSTSNIATLVPGTANGQQVAFYATGASVSETSETCTPSNSGYSGGPSTLTCTIAYSVTANGAPVYIPQAAGTSATANVVGFDSFVSSAPTTAIVSGATPAIALSASVTQVGTNATTSGGGNEWTINAGVTANFVATVVITDPTSVHSGQYRSFLVALPWGLGTGVWNQTYNFNLGSINTVVPGYTQIN